MRGIGQGFGSALGIIALVAAALLSWGARGEGRGLALVLGCAIALARQLVDLTLVVVAMSIVLHGVSVTPLMRMYSARRR